MKALLRCLLNAAPAADSCARCVLLLLLLMSAPMMLASSD
jgi:hypothetical protein